MNRRLNNEIQSVININKNIQIVLDKCLSDKSFFADSDKKTIRNINSLLRKFRAAYPHELIKHNVEYLNNETLEVKALAVLSGKYLNIKNQIISKYEFKDQVKQVEDELKEKGYIEVSEGNILPTKFAGTIDNIYFCKYQDILIYLIKQMGELKITNRLIERLSREFSCKFPTVRAVIATLERMDSLQKIESDIFVETKLNEKLIAKEMYAIISKIKFNYLTKEILFNLCAEPIFNNDLKLDEPYYILKRWYKNKLFFSKGNQMLISKKEEYAKMSTKERFNTFLKKPYILTKDELATIVGLNEFSTVNFKDMSMIKDKYLYFDRNNKEHVKYLISKIQPFFKKHNGVEVKTRDFRIWCEISSDLFVSRLHDISHFTLLINAFDGKLQYYKDSHSFIYSDNNKQILDVSNWEDMEW